MGYIIGYFIVGYFIATAAALFAPPSEKAERVDMMTLIVTIGWGLYGLVILWQVLCIPVNVVRRVRLRMAERATNEQ